MASGDINFRMGADPTRALAANGRFVRSQKGVDKSLDNTTKVSARMANAIIRDTESAEKRYSRLAREAKAAFNADKIGFGTYSNRMAQLRKDLENHTGQFKKFKQEGSDALGEVGERATTAGDLIDGMAGRVTGALGVTQLLRQGWEEVETAIRNAAESVTEQRSGVGQLRQLANNQTEFDTLKNTAKRFRLAGATNSLGEAAQVVFDLDSADLLDAKSERLFLQLGARQVVPDLGKFAKAIRTQLSSFGRAETGDAVQIASKAFAASNFSPASVEELLEAASVPGGVARSLRISDEENLAAVALLATTTGSGNVGATALRSFLSSTAQLEGFEGLNIVQRVAKLKAKNLSVAQLLKSPSEGGLGRQEAVRAFNDLQDKLGKLKEITAAVDRANKDRSAIDRKIGFTDPVGEAARLEQSAKAQAEFTAESLGARRLITDAARERSNAQVANQVGPSVAAVAIGLANTSTGIGRVIGGQRGVEAQIQGSVTNESEEKALESLRRMPDALDRHTAVMEQMIATQINEQKETNSTLKQGSGIPVTNE